MTAVPPEDGRPEEPPPSAGPTDDEVFAQIVAGFTRESTDEVPRWPVDEDVTEEERPRRRRTDPPPAAPDAPAPADGLPDWVEPDALPDEGRYVPPPPPRLPRPRARTVLAVLMVLAGLAVLFVPFRIGLDDSTGWVLIGLLLTGGGASMLVAGMRGERGGDGPADGAGVEPPVA